MKNCELCVDASTWPRPHRFCAVLVDLLMAAVFFAVTAVGVVAFVGSSWSWLSPFVLILIGVGAFATFLFLREIIISLRRIWLWRFRDKHGDMHLHKVDPCIGYAEFYFGDGPRRIIKERWSGWYLNSHKGTATRWRSRSNIWCYMESWGGSAVLLECDAGVELRLSATDAFDFFEAIDSDVTAVRWNVMLSNIGHYDKLYQEGREVGDRLEEALAQLNNVGTTLMCIEQHMELNPRKAGRSRHADAFKKILQEGLTNLSGEILPGYKINLEQWRREARIRLGAPTLLDLPDVDLPASAVEQDAKQMIASPGRI